jgi:protein-tyrosine-phosphatase
MIRTRWHGLGMLSLGAAYFAFYAPYSALANTLARGLLPGIDRPGSGLELLPAAALGTIAGVALFLALTGWWRHARRFLMPGRGVLLASFFHALIIGATTLNYSFEGISILFVLLLMRGGVLVLSPLVDTLRRHYVAPASWVALALSLSAVAVALADVDNYSLSLGAVLSLSAYFAGYIGRFQIMATEAKSQGMEANRRYFVEEQMLSAPILLAGLAVGAALGPGAGGEMLRRGFTSFLGTEGALAAFLVGLLYAGLSAAGSLIYVDPREYTYCVPVNRGASLLSGVVASYGLAFLLSLRPPSPLQLTAAGLVLGALAVLARPDWVEGRLPAFASSRRLFLFVCSGNTCRSPMATAIARAELAARFGRRPPVRVESAGLTVRPGTPMTSEAEVALCEIGVSPGRHQARLLTAELVERAEAIYCMTASHREAVLRMLPGAAGKTWCIDPGGDIPDPIGSALEVYVGCARRLRDMVRSRFDELLAGA